MKNYLSNYCEQLVPFTYVSFDIFDTLMYRTVSDFTMIHQMVAKLYKEQYGISLPFYSKQRVDAEIEARNVLGRNEVNMDMIFECLSGYSEEEKNRLRLLEEKCEVDNCVSNPLMIAVWKWCRDNGKKIVITTDMYLSRKVLNAILSKIGVDYDYLYISGEEGVTKRTSELFAVVLKKMNIKPTQIIHIGDDLNNDINMPKMKGIASLLRLSDETRILPYIKVKQCDSSLEKDHLFSLLSRYCSNRESLGSEQRIGYTVLGPLIVDFCQWLHTVRKEYNLHKLFFVAREGFLIKKVYERMYPQEADDLMYIRLNKNLLRLPLLSMHNACEYFMKAKIGRLTYDWKLIFDLLYISDYESVKHFITLRTGFDRFHETMTLKELESGKYNEILTLLIEFQRDMIEEQCLLFDEYLMSLGFWGGSVGLVNNSINGNGQSMLTDYLLFKGKECDILGLQFIKTSKCEQLLKGKCRAWLTESSVSEFSKTRFYSNCLLLEHLMFEPNGTSIRFYRHGNKVEVLCESPRTEQKDFEKIANIQKYALEFVADYTTHIGISLNMVGFYGYFNMLCNPLYEDAALLGHLNDDDIDGDKEISDIRFPFRFKYLFSKDIPFDITWHEGYFTLKNVSRWGINLYLYSVRLQFYKQIVKSYIKRFILRH